MSDHEEVSVRSYACPYCSAPVGSRCRTASGKPCPTHLARWEPLALAFSEGYEQGERAAKADEPRGYFDIMAGHVVVAVHTRADDVGETRRTDVCDCGAECPDYDGGFAGHLVDVMHENDLVVARLA